MNSLKKSLKKILFTACVGLGLGYSMSALALPDYDTCVGMRDDCRAGVASSCTTFNRLCGIYGIEP